MLQLDYRFGSTIWPVRGQRLQKEKTAKRGKNLRACKAQQSKHNDYPLDTRRHLNVHKTFRRHPGRVL